MSMDTKIINESLKLCLEGKSTFLEHVKKISESGVVKYLVNLKQGTVHYYGNNYDEHQAKLPNIFEKKNSIFSKERVIEAISLAQQKKINYLDFLDKISLGGITTYNVDITGKCVTYISSTGDKHIELFPNTTPKI